MPNVESSPVSLITDVIPNICSAPCVPAKGSVMNVTYRGVSYRVSTEAEVYALLAYLAQRAAC